MAPAVVRLVVDLNMFAELEVDLVADSGTATAMVADQVVDFDMLAVPVVELAVEFDTMTLLVIDFVADFDTMAAALVVDWAAALTVVAEMLIAVDFAWNMFGVRLVVDYFEVHAEFLLVGHCLDAVDVLQERLVGLLVFD